MSKKTSAVVGALALMGTTFGVAGQANAAAGSCFTWTQSSRAYAACTVSSGQFRVRADCVLAPDLYSPWVGKGTWTIWTGACPWGIRGAIIESRN
jgi:hypothetical protein